MLDRLGQQIDRAAEPEEAFHGVADERWMKARMTGLGVTGLAVRVWVDGLGHNRLGYGEPGYDGAALRARLIVPVMVIGLRGTVL